MTNPFQHNEARLVTAKDLEQLDIMPKGTAYRMAKVGAIPSYALGAKGRGVRFKLEEVLAAKAAVSLRKCPICPP